MHHLRPTAIAGLLLAIVPATALSSCGFDYPTDRVNTIGAGVSDRDASIDALGIRVLAFADGEGRLIGSLANNTDEQESLQDVTSPDGSVTSGAFKAVKVAPHGSVNLAEGTPVALTGDFAPGDVVSVELVFSTGERVSLEAPVVKPCFQYSDIETPSAFGSASPSDAATDEHATDEHATDDHAADEHATDEHAAGSGAAYTCEHPTEGHGGGH